MHRGGGDVPLPGIEAHRGGEPVPSPYVGVHRCGNPTPHVRQHGTLRMHCRWPGSLFVPTWRPKQAPTRRCYRATLPHYSPALACTLPCAVTSRQHSRLVWFMLQCSKAKQSTENGGYDHKPVTRGYMQAQYLLLMALRPPTSWWRPSSALPARVAGRVGYGASPPPPPPACGGGLNEFTNSNTTSPSGQAAQCHVVHAAQRDSVLIA